MSLVTSEQYTFEQLHTNNITPIDLMLWSAPLDTIENYQRYLDYGYQSDTYYFYNCSEYWFGPHCEYTFDRLDSFGFILEDRFSYRIDHDIDKNLQNSGGKVPSYIHMDGCERTDGLNLTWQEICDRKTDCISGEDEIDCDQLEGNTCLWNDEW